jgi:hypothetical protein
VPTIGRVDSQSSSGMATGCGLGRQVPHWTASSTTSASARARDAERLT